MLSFATRSDDVFLRQCAESNALLSLSRPANGDALDSNDQGTDGCCDARRASNLVQLDGFSVMFAEPVKRDSNRAP